MSAVLVSAFEKFGKYLLLEKIAVGGMAEVYLAKSAVANGLNKFVAVKRILPQYFSNEEFIDMFKEEAKVAINLNHSNVVTIYDFGIEKKQFFLVMEFVEGRNLRQIINELKKNNKSFSIDQAIYMVKEVAAGLDHAHRCVDANSGRPLNITHRDMSPQNIMVSFEGEVKVIDFGIAKAETEKEETKAGTLKGKFSYMSPEQAEGSPIDPRTDIFAIGIVLWELLANDRLFTGSNEAAILRKVRECQIPLIRKVNPLVPQELERIVMKALAKDKNVRYQTAANLHRDLNRFLNMQYPDFSSQDFSMSLKDAFKASYLEAREKLIHYSKAEIIDSTLNPAPGLANTMTATLAPSPDFAGEEPPRPIPTSELPPAAVSPSEQQAKINLDGLLGAHVTKPKPATPHFNFQNTKLNPSSSINKPSSSSMGSGGHTRVTQASQTSHSKLKSQRKDFIELAFKLIIFGLLLAGVDWGYKNGFRNLIETSLARLSPPPEVDKLKGQIELSATASVKVSVSTLPAGAQIFADGKDTGYLSPAIITITANKETVIALKKEGYLTYEITKKASHTDVLTATLQPAAKAGYLNIYIANGGPSTKIYVNGKELAEKAPVMKYPIMADAQTIIKAYNPITQQKDEMKIILHPGESKSVDLILGRSQQVLKK